jgi:hypothetical protein
MSNKNIKEKLYFRYFKDKINFLYIKMFLFSRKNFFIRNIKKIFKIYIFKTFGKKKFNLYLSSSYKNSTRVNYFVTSCLRGWEKSKYIRYLFNFFFIKKGDSIFSSILRARFYNVKINYKKNIYKVLQKKINVFTTYYLSQNIKFY